MPVMEVQSGFRHGISASPSLSSSSISSAPSSPAHQADTIHVARPPNQTNAFGEGVVRPASASSVSAALANNAHAHNANAHASISADAAEPVKPKRPRKKKDSDPAATPIDDGKPKEKKTRKPRAPTTTATSGAVTGGPRKKQKTAEMVNGPPSPNPIIEFFKRNGVQRSLPPSSAPPTPRPISSGQNYDPIRSANIESTATRPLNGTHSALATRQMNHRASASPSIASLIDPPAVIRISAPNPYSPQTEIKNPVVPSQRSPPAPPQQSDYAVSQPYQDQPTRKMSQSMVASMDGAMDVDPFRCDITQAEEHSPIEVKVQSKTSSSAPTPKPSKPPSPPRATGSGLLSSSDLFGGPSADKGSQRRGVDIDIRIQLDPKGGNTINIAHEILKKYGRSAINPRAAAHREELLQVAAAANKIDGGSADDMSVDLMSELDGDSNAEMGGMDDEKSGTAQDGEQPKRQRRKKVEEYDKEDDFIDDTELAWVEQSAVAKDGFFVYSGPLVPEGETARVETSAPTRGTRGRARGGRARGAAASAAGTTHASLAAKTGEPGSTSRGRARGRGSGAPRKPRITKADRERMDAEKMEREQNLLLMGGHSGGVPLAMATSGIAMSGGGHHVSSGAHA